MRIYIKRAFILNQDIRNVVFSNIETLITQSLRDRIKW